MFGSVWSSSSTQTSVRKDTLSTYKHQVWRRVLWVWVYLKCNLIRKFSFSLSVPVVSRVAATFKRPAGPTETETCLKSPPRHSFTSPYLTVWTLVNCRHLMNCRLLADSCAVTWPSSLKCDSLWDCKQTLVYIIGSITFSLFEDLMSRKHFK